MLGAQLRKARDTLKLEPEEVAARLKVEPKDIIDWESGRSQPDLSQTERLAQLYRRDIDYFLRETPAPPAQIEFRSVTPRSFRELSEEARLVIAEFDELCRTALELERLTGEVRRPSVEQLRPDVPPLSLARAQREGLGLGQKPVRTLRELLTQRGVRIFQLVVPPGQFSGFSYWHLDYGPCILLNAKELPGRRNFTLAHEYAHVLYRHPPSVCDLKQEGRSSLRGVEKSADLFAIHFLLPEEPLRTDFSKRTLPNRPSLKEIGELSGRWCVSVQAMAYRLEELGLIERGHADKLLAHYAPQRLPTRAPKVPRWERRLGRQFVSNAIKAYEAGEISLGKLARSLNLPVRKALEVAEHYARAR